MKNNKGLKIALISTSSALVLAIAYILIIVVFGVGVEEPDNTLTPPPAPVFEYELSEDGHYILKRYLGEDKVVTVPSMYNDIPVKEIAEYAFVGSNIREITVPDTVEAIGFGAFDHCYELGKITIPFVGSDVEYPRASHFSYIFGIKEVAIDKPIDQQERNVLILRYMTEVTITMGNRGPGVYIPAGAFYGVKNLTKVVIQGEAVGIGNMAFAECTDLASITIPDSVQYIGKKAFYKTAIKDITLPSGLKSIGGEALAYNTLNDIVLPNTVETIGSGVFYGSKIKSVRLPENIEKIPSEMFRQTRITETLVLPESVTEIGSYAFAACRADLSWNPRNIKRLEEYAFEYFSKYVDHIISLPKVEYIGDGCFKELWYGRKGHIDLSTNSSLKYIGANAFQDVDMMGITIPESVTYIGSGAFRVTDGEHPQYSIQFEDKTGWYMYELGADTGEAIDPIDLASDVAYKLFSQTRELRKLD